MSSLSNNEFNLTYILNGINADIEAHGRKTGTAGNASGIHGDVTPEGELLPHTKGNLSFDPPV